MKYMWFAMFGYLLSSVTTRVDHEQCYSDMIYPLSLLILWVVIGFLVVAMREINKWKYE